MTITNRHVGWGIVAIPFLFPFIHMIFDTKTPEWVQNWAVVVIGLSLVFIVGTIIYILIALFLDDIEFEWHINLPKRKKKALPSHSDFLKLGTLDQDSDEWRKIWNKLNDKGQWG